MTLRGPISISLAAVGMMLPEISLERKVPREFPFDSSWILLKTPKTKNSIKQIALWQWVSLTAVFGFRPRKSPEIYQFNSPGSQGSLKRRTAEEKDLVHLQ